MADTQGRALKIVHSLVCALCVLALGACGAKDSVEKPLPPAPPITKAEFLREADEICFASEAQIEAAADDLVAGRREIRPGRVKRVALRIVVPALRTEVTAIRALGSPPGDERKIEAILAATEAGIAQIEADPAGLLDGVPKPVRKAQRLAAAYGSRECGIRG